MADRIARIAGAFVLTMTVTGTSACRGANDGDANSILASMDGAASVSTAIVRAIDGAVVDDYVVQTLSRSSGPIGGAQPCVTAANRTRQRPSALVNPPYAEASILQRDRAMRALGAYAFLLVTVARNDASADSNARASRCRTQRTCTRRAISSSRIAPRRSRRSPATYALRAIVRRCTTCCCEPPHRCNSLWRLWRSACRGAVLATDGCGRPGALCDGPRSAYAGYSSSRHICIRSCARARCNRSRRRIRGATRVDARGFNAPGANRADRGCEEATRPRRRCGGDERRAALLHTALSARFLVCEA